MYPNYFIINRIHSYSSAWQLSDLAPKFLSIQDLRLRSSLILLGQTTTIHSNNTPEKKMYTMYCSVVFVRYVITFGRFVLKHQNQTEDKWIRIVCLYVGVRCDTHTHSNNSEGMNRLDRYIHIPTPSNINAAFRIQHNTSSTLVNHVMPFSVITPTHDLPFDFMNHLHRFTIY